MTAVLDRVGPPLSITAILLVIAGRVLIDAPEVATMAYVAFIIAIPPVTYATMKYDEKHHGERGGLAYIVSAIAAALLGALNGLYAFDPYLIDGDALSLVNTVVFAVLAPAIGIWLRRRMQEPTQDDPEP